MLAFPKTYKFRIKIQNFINFLEIFLGTFLKSCLGYLCVLKIYSR